MRCKLSLMKRYKILWLFLAVSLVLIVILYLDDFINKIDLLVLHKRSPLHQDWSANVFGRDLSKNNHISLDIHHEHVLSLGKDHMHRDDNLIAVAIGIALTSKGTHNVTAENLRYKFPFFRTLLPSFCKTSTQGYSYHFYVAFDPDDDFFSHKPSLKWFSDTFGVYSKTMCSYVTELRLHLIECNHNRKPAWAQNDAMMEAYLDDVDFYYRVNDDSLMKSPGWTELYIKTLQSLQPPNIGVVGPKHYSGNTEILVYDFVHRTHIDIFGFYYPRIFTDWFADDWITTVYQPNRTVKLPQVKVLHTQLLGTRYTNQFGLVQYLKEELLRDKISVQRWIAAFSTEYVPNVAFSNKSKRVIAYSLSSLDSDLVFGQIRNIILATIYFPGWKIFIYTLSRIISKTDRLYKKFTSLGATVVFKDDILSGNVPLSMLNYLVQDEKDVDVYIIRSALDRLSNRDVLAVKSWLQTDQGFFCTRDHPSHRSHAINANLWGARHKVLQDKITKSVENILNTFAKSLELDFVEEQFLNTILWNLVKDISFCHDSQACNSWPNSYKFPVKRIGFEYLGREIGAFEVPKNNSDNTEIKLNLLDSNTNCSLVV